MKDIGETRNYCLEGIKRMGLEEKTKKLKM